jgi:periplasmic protein TonB
VKRAPTSQPSGGGLRRAAAAGGVLAAALCVALSGIAARAASGPSQPAPAQFATPAVPDSRHYPANELDARPGIKVRVNPAYPARAAQQNMSGKAVVRLYIDANGMVERVEVERATPPGYGFEESAANAFRGARFSPAMKDGKRVRALMRIEVSFDAPTAKPGR